MIVWPNTDRAHRARMERFTMHPGDRFHNFSAGGGGWGDPLDRSIELVLQDVLDEYVSVEQAEKAYGVKVEADGNATPTRARLDLSPS